MVATAAPKHEAQCLTDMQCSDDRMHAWSTIGEQGSCADSHGWVSCCKLPEI